MAAPIQIGVCHILPALKMETIYYPETFLTTYHTNGIINQKTIKSVSTAFKNSDLVQLIDWFVTQHFYGEVVRKTSTLQTAIEMTVTLT